MKDQIKIQVSDDGLFGREVNPYQIDPDKIYPLMGEDNILQAKEAFKASHSQLPLTTPKIPKSVVMGEVVWQSYNSDFKKWNTLPNERKGIYANSFKEFTNFCPKDGARQAYHITPVPNSEPMETVEEETCNRCGFPYESSDHIYNNLSNG